MSENNVVGVILPTTHHLMKLKNPPVRQMIEEGVIVALGSDFNPNCFCMSMPEVMSLACINFKMLPSEALVASTLNSAGK
jgi:imidazolonepropionase